MSSSAPPTPSYTSSQLQQYFNYISLPSEYHQYATSPHTLNTLSSDQQLKFLQSLVHHQLTHVPFENLDLHYSAVPGISLSTLYLFHKVVERRAGRGGYCMQNNALFATVLRSLGYQVMSAGARVSKVWDAGANSTLPPGPEPIEVGYGGFAHQINIVTIQGKRFFVDVGFGSAGPTFPVPLEHGFNAVNTGHGDRIASSVKLIRGFAAESTARVKEQELWIYCVKYGRADDDTKPWVPCYCFPEIEFFPSDFERLSYYVATSRTSIFVRSIICQKFLMGEDGNTLIGDVTLSNDKIRERRYGETKELMQIKTEEDRVSALERFLDVKLNDAEIGGIQGLPTALP